MEALGSNIDVIFAQVSAETASKCDGCVVTKGVNPDSVRTLCQYDGYSGAQHEPSVDETGPVGGWLLITPGQPLVLLTGPNPCETEESGGGTGGGGEGGSGEGGTGGSGEGGTGGGQSGGSGEGGSGGGETGGSGEGGAGGAGEGESGGSGAGGTGGSGEGVTQTPESGDGAAAP